MATTSTSNNTDYSVNGFCSELGCGRTFFYSQEGKHAPRQVLIGGRRFVIESPREYLERMAALQSEVA